MGAWPAWVFQKCNLVFFLQYEKVLTEANYEKSKHIISAIKNMSMDEALSFLEYKKADKRKMLDKLEYETRKVCFHSHFFFFSGSLLKMNFMP